jgi:hypothetical protein
MFAGQAIALKVVRLRFLWQVPTSIAATSPSALSFPRTLMYSYFASVLWCLREGVTSVTLNTANDSESLCESLLMK